MIRKSLLIVFAGAFIFGATAYAHHSLAATYYPDKEVKLEGKIIDFLFRNPHSVVLVETPGEKGQPIIWAAEWGSGGQLSRQGIEMDTLKPGDHVIIIGNPSRNSADRRLRMLDITRLSDGWKWGSSP